MGKHEPHSQVDGVAADVRGDGAGVAGASDRGVTAPATECFYCGKLFHRRSDRTSFCSRSCPARYYEAGGKSRAEIELVHPRNRAPQPKGCSTVEQFLAAGGYVFRLPDRVLS